MSWSVTTAQEEETWFNDYLSEVIGVMPPPLPPRVQRIGSTTVRWWEGQPGDVVVMSEGGSFDDRHLAEQIVLSDLKQFGYKRAVFTLSDNGDFRKTATWQEVQAKAVRLKNNGQVTILRNGWNVLVANVVGDHGQYEVTISRDDPNSRAITQWTCECPWDQYAFNRTRKWKKYEGRCCSHVLAAYWQGQATPIDDYDPNKHGPMPRGQRPGQPVQQGELFDRGVGKQPTSPGGGATNEVSTGGGVPKGVDQSEITDSGGAGGPLPGAPRTVQAPGIPTGTSPVTAPTAPTAPSAPKGQPAKPPKPSPSRGQGQQVGPGPNPVAQNPVAQPSDAFDVIPPAPDYGEQMQLPFSVPVGEDQTGGRNLHLPGALSKVIGQPYRHVRKSNSELEAEQVVQLLPPENAENWKGEYGIAVGGAPGRGTGESWLVGPNSIGKIFSVDRTLDWATVHFPLHETGELQPHFVEVILPSSQLAPRPDVGDPFIGPR